MPGPIKNLADRLKARTDSSGGPMACWPWLGATDHHGYGAIGDQFPSRRILKTHRVAFELANGPTALDVLHSCDNPRCVNPAHLRAGTAKENARDMVQRGRAGGAKLSPEQIENIRNDPRPHRVVARDHALAHSTVGRIRRGEIWANE